jgi:NAD(P)-dependent dehydrogenase (short-subunit alcohol dehydrogenase family)
VTGISSGIGFSLISSVLKAGHRIVGLSRNPSKVLLPSNSDDTNTFLLPVDLSSTAPIQEAFAKGAQKFGRIDVVVNNAGYGLTAELESMSDAAHRQLMEINYFAPVTLTRLAIAQMRTQLPPGGTIAQISSIGGMVTTPGSSAYHASKHAIEGFTKAVAQELDPAWGIKMICFQPGAVATKWGAENMDFAPQHEAYVGKNLATDQMKALRQQITGFGANPDTVADVIVEVVAKGELLGRIPLGVDAWTLALGEKEKVGEYLEKVKEVSQSTSTEAAKEKWSGFRLFN